MHEYRYVGVLLTRFAFLLHIPFILAPFGVVDDGDGDVVVVNQQFYSRATPTAPLTLHYIIPDISFAISTLAMCATRCQDRRALPLINRMGLHLF